MQSDNLGAGLLRVHCFGIREGHLAISCAIHFNFMPKPEPSMLDCV